MKKEIYYLDDASLEEKYWFLGENGFETYSETEFVTFENFANGVLLSQQNHVDDYEYEFEEYIDYYFENK